MQCLAKMHLAGAELSFNLKLEDPIEAFLEADSPWRGVGGDYRVSLGPQSMAEIGSDPALPTLEASVGAFTRLWSGAHPARRLALSDHFVAKPQLIEQLDWALPPASPVDRMGVLTALRWL